MRGNKLCPSCGTGNGPRSHYCKSCQHPFAIKSGKGTPSLAAMRAKRSGVIKERGFDWRELRRGDRIKVVQGTGPYLPVENADPVNMGYSGDFAVLYITKDHIIATGNKKEGESAYCAIYMGEPGDSPYGLYREPHKIIRLKPRKENET